MPVLNGGLTGIAPATSTDTFLTKFIESISDDEWRVLAELPPLKRVTQLVATVCALRVEFDNELPAYHPLAAAR